MSFFRRKKSWYVNDSPETNPESDEEFQYKEKHRLGKETRQKSTNKFRNHEKNRSHSKGTQTCNLSISSEETPVDINTPPSSETQDYVYIQPKKSKSRWWKRKKKRDRMPRMTESEYMEYMMKNYPEYYYEQMGGRGTGRRRMRDVEEDDDVEGEGDYSGFSTSRSRSRRKRDNYRYVKWDSKPFKAKQQHSPGVGIEFSNRGNKPRGKFTNRRRDLTPRDEPDNRSQSLTHESRSRRHNRTKTKRGKNKEEYVETALLELMKYIKLQQKDNKLVNRPWEVVSESSIEDVRTKTGHQKSRRSRNHTSESRSTESSNKDKRHRRREKSWSTRGHGQRNASLFINRHGRISFNYKGRPNFRHSDRYDERDRRMRERNKNIIEKIKTDLTPWLDSLPWRRKILDSDHSIDEELNKAEGQSEYRDEENNRIKSDQLNIVENKVACNLKTSATGKEENRKMRASLSEPVDHMRILNSNQIKPPTSPLTPRRSANLLSNIL